MPLKTCKVERKEGPCTASLIFDTGHDSIEVHAVVATAAVDKRATLTSFGKRLVTFTFLYTMRGKEAHQKRKHWRPEQGSHLRR